MAPKKVRQSLEPKVEFRGKLWTFKGVRLRIPPWCDEYYAKYITGCTDRDVSEEELVFIPLEILREAGFKVKGKEPNFQHVSFIRGMLEAFTLPKDGIKGLWVKNFALEIIKVLWYYLNGRMPYHRMGYGLNPKALRKYNKKGKLWNSR